MDSGLAVSRRPGMTPALVPKVPRAGHHHGDAGLVGSLDHFVVAHRAAGLNDGGGARFNATRKPVGERYVIEPHAREASSGALAFSRSGLQNSNQAIDHLIQRRPVRKIDRLLGVHGKVVWRPPMANNPIMAIALVNNPG
jgi:hypothetical protein